MPGRDAPAAAPARGEANEAEGCAAKAAEIGDDQPEVAVGGPRVDERRDLAAAGREAVSQQRQPLSGGEALEKEVGNRHPFETQRRLRAHGRGEPQPLEQGTPGRQHRQPLLERLDRLDGSRHRDGFGPDGLVEADERRLEVAEHVPGEASVLACVKRDHERRPGAVGRRDVDPSERERFTVRPHGRPQPGCGCADAPEGEMEVDLGRVARTLPLLGQIGRAGRCVTELTQGRAGRLPVDGLNEDVTVAVASGSVMVQARDRRPAQDHRLPPSGEQRSEELAGIDVGTVGPVPGARDPREHLVGGGGTRNHGPIVAGTGQRPWRGTLGSVGRLTAGSRRRAGAGHPRFAGSGYPGRYSQRVRGCTARPIVWMTMGGVE